MLLAGSMITDMIPLQN